MAFIKEILKYTKLSNLSALCFTHDKLDNTKYTHKYTFIKLIMTKYILVSHLLFHPKTSIFKFLVKKVNIFDCWLTIIKVSFLFLCVIIIVLESKCPSFGPL